MPAYEGVWKKMCFQGSASERCQYVVAKEVYLTTPRDFVEIVTALGGTSMDNFMLDLADDYEDRVVDTSTEVANSGLILNALFRGCLPCTVDGQHVPLRSTVGSVKYDLSSSSVSDGVFTAICSAVVELPTGTLLKSLEFYSVCRDRWKWLVYALCCGSSVFRLENLDLIGTSLTRADVVAMGEVLKIRYPVVSSEQRRLRVPQYGFVSIEEGTELSSTRLAEDDIMVLRSASAFRCRARYCPIGSAHWADVIVPGYGICRTRIEDGASSFDPDSLAFGHRIDRGFYIRSLNLHIGKIELNTLVLDLLGFIGAGLRKLSMIIDESDPNEVYDQQNRTDLDLGRLAAVCPGLEALELTYFDVVVLPTHDGALLTWPIKKNWY
ncbi:hypothetical protein PHYPSEUDO_015474 [Phytophthora pseudosyringae]|uniref:Uncharacterized protein n=1 Tax=Phytophthora pseudosyringae TaxID=221518 RepID=A0A8T1W040_9STRA|nr:hypothetical protein PHYPSEUDO_015474 [Phytophthora pseudosyringae]